MFYVNSMHAWIVYDVGDFQDYPLKFCYEYKSNTDRHGILKGKMLGLEISFFRESCKIA